MSHKRASVGLASKKGAPAFQKRKREAEEVSEDEEADEMDLDAMLAAEDDGEDDDDEDEDEEDDGEGMDDDDDDEDLDIDPQEVAAMQHMLNKNKSSSKKQKNKQQEEESSEDDGEEEADEGTGTIARPAKKQKVEYLNNKAALLDKLGDIALPASYPWIETLQLTTKKSFAQATEEAPDAVHDDLKREAAFYELSLNCASEGLQQLTDLDIPFRIPPDFFAERVKPDKHMNRIKDKLIEEQRKMQAVSERKAEKETRRFAKQVQSNKFQEKAAEKKQNLAIASRMRKVEDSKDKELGIERSILPGVQQHLAANKADEDRRREKKNAKREAKDKKYGHGGKKRNQRKNDKDSAHAGKDYQPSKMRTNFQGFKDAKPGSFQERRGGSNKGGQNFNKNGSQFGGRGGGGGFSRKSGGGGGKPNRPGKSARAASRR